MRLILSHRITSHLICASNNIALYHIKPHRSQCITWKSLKFLEVCFQILDSSMRRIDVWKKQEPARCVEWPRSTWSSYRVVIWSVAPDALRRSRTVQSVDRRSEELFEHILTNLNWPFVTYFRRTNGQFLEYSITFTKAQRQADNRFVNTQTQTYMLRCINEYTRVRPNKRSSVPAFLVYERNEI